MASLILGAVGNKYGGSIGGAIGALAGRAIDSYLFASSTTGTRRTDLSLTTSIEGAPIPRIDGRIRIGGQVIWASKYKESTSTSGGKGGAETTEYEYSISFAVGLCQGIVGGLGRVWADGNLLDTSQYTIRFYTGTEDQAADPIIEEIEGEGNSPAYRGLAYVVFEDMALEDFGNRIPQLQFELTRSITADMHEDALENLVTAVNLIPGAGEFVYATTVVVRDYGGGVTKPENQANSSGVADVLLSLDALIATCPNLTTVALVVGWFASDLRAGACTIKPKVEVHGKSTYGEYTDDDGDTKETDYSWKVDGIGRADADIVSTVDGYPAYGGTPSDRSVKQLIKEITSRGLKIAFYPFLFMDIADDNALANPYSDNAATSGQPAYPWRGRITVSPAAGYAGSVDLTTEATDQIDAFFTGSWGYNRFVAHYAELCVAAGGVGSFIIASELKGLTQARSAASTYPAVTALKTLAATVKGIVGSDCAVGYAADWSEWNGHQTGDADGAFQFHLDPLWSDDNIDFIGIDNYMPLADWRDGSDHLDYDTDGPTSPRDIDYLQANIEGGEYYDWYYASDADRDSQTRTAIADEDCGKPWIWRAKDLKNWWLNRHYNRIDGSEGDTATDWVPQGKPFRFTELGCPAIDRGANQPNVFYDAKSSESAYPYYSSGERDDLMQRAFLEAHLRYWSDSTHNPTSSVYAGSMVDGGETALWAWDARPFPFFPGRNDLWRDAENYALGHWLNGRLGSVLLADLVSEICTESGFDAFDVDDLEGLVTGYVRDQTASARDELESLSQAFFFDAVESQGTIAFLMRGRPASAALTADDLAVDPEDDAQNDVSLTRALDSERPVAVRITFIDPENGYEQGAYQAKRLVGNSNRIDESSIPLVMDRSQAGGIGDRMIQERWLGRETATFSLPPSFLALDAADEVTLTLGDRSRRLRLSQIEDADSRAVQGVASDPTLYESLSGAARDSSSCVGARQTGRVLLSIMDIPILDADDDPYAPHLAATADPWPGSALLYRSASGSGYALDTTIASAANIGETLSDFYSGPTGRWDEVNTLTVQMYRGALSSSDEVAVLNGANVLAIQNGDEWEIVQFRDAELVDTMTWTVSGLLRGQLGSEQAMASSLAAGARVVVLNDKVLQSSMPSAQYAASFHYKYGPAGKAISDVSYQNETLACKGVGLRPYAPCHVGFSWNDSGDVTIFWLRRDRDPAADGWDGADAPLSEETESYDVEIRDSSGAVLRTIGGLTVSSYLYSATNQAADFGTALSAGSTLTIGIYQLSTVFGRGSAKTATLYL